MKNPLRFIDCKSDKCRHIGGLSLVPKLWLPELRAFLARHKGRKLPLSYRAASSISNGHERGQAVRRQSRFSYSQGPMMFIGQQIVKAMQDAGYPAKILYCYRSPEHQQKLYDQGRKTKGDIVTRAKPFQSAHQYYLAVDIIHPTLGWSVSEDYWDALASCVRIVSERFNFPLEHGHTWSFRDSAHIEYKHWRTLADVNVVPSNQTLWSWFEELLPDRAKQHLQSFASQSVRRSA